MGVYIPWMSPFLIQSVLSAASFQGRDNPGGPGGETPKAEVAGPQQEAQQPTPRDREHHHRPGRHQGGWNQTRQYR